MLFPYKETPRGGVPSILLLSIRWSRGILQTQEACSRSMVHRVCSGDLTMAVLAVVVSTD